MAIYLRLRSVPRSNSGPHVYKNRCPIGPSAVAGRLLFGVRRDGTFQSHRSYPSHLASTRNQAAVPDSLGGGDGTRARSDHRVGVPPARSQCHRQPRRLLRALSRARGFFRRARSDPAFRPHQHLSRRNLWAVPAMVGPAPHRVPGSLGPSSPTPSRRKSMMVSTSVRPSR